MHAADFLRLMYEQGLKFDRALFDPPFSPRQLTECYSALGHSLTLGEVQDLWGIMRDAIDLVLKPGGIVIGFGWNSIGMGRKRGYQVIDGLLINHGGNRNDTICLVEQKG
jgi:hypothetical protein